MNWKDNLVERSIAQLQDFTVECRLDTSYQMPDDCLRGDAYRRWFDAYSKRRLYEISPAAYTDLNQRFPFADHEVQCSFYSNQPPDLTQISICIATPNGLSFARLTQYERAVTFRKFVAVMYRAYPKGGIKTTVPYIYDLCWLDDILFVVETCPVHQIGGTDLKPVKTAALEAVLTRRKIEALIT